MRCNAFVEAWKNHHRRASMILGLSLLAAPLSYAVYAEDGVSNTMVQVVTQTKTVKGTIIDESGEPLIGVSIVVKGTSTGTITDFNGNFSIDLPAGKRTGHFLYRLQRTNGDSDRQRTGQCENGFGYTGIG